MLVYIGSQNHIPVVSLGLLVQKSKQYECMCLSSGEVKLHADIICVKCSFFSQKQEFKKNVIFVCQFLDLLQEMSSYLLSHLVQDMEELVVKSQRACNVFQHEN